MALWWEKKETLHFDFSFGKIALSKLLQNVESPFTGAAPLKAHGWSRLTRGDDDVMEKCHPLPITLTFLLAATKNQSYPSIEVVREIFR